MVKIRLRKTGKKNSPCYRLVATDSRNPRDGRFIEILGIYDPIHDNENIKMDRIEYWLGVGAQPTRTVASIIRRVKSENVEVKPSLKSIVRESKAKEVAESKAKEVAESKAKEVAESKIKEVAESKAKEVAESKIKEVAESKAKEVAKAQTKEVAEANVQKSVEVTEETPVENAE